MLGWPQGQHGIIYQHLNHHCDCEEALSRLRSDAKDYTFSLDHKVHTKAHRTSSSAQVHKWRLYGNVKAVVWVFAK
jgi:hypothetical protein